MFFCIVESITNRVIIQCDAKRTCYRAISVHVLKLKLHYKLSFIWKIAFVGIHVYVICWRYMLCVGCFKYRSN